MIGNNENGPGTMADNARMAQQFAEFSEQTQRIFQSFMQRQAEGDVPPGFDPAAVSRAFWDWNDKLMRDPTALSQANAEYWRRMSLLYEASNKRAKGEEAAPVATPEKGDRRFKHAAWDEDVVFDHMKQAYLIYADYAQSLANQPGDLDPHHQHMVDFYTRRAIEAISPSNFAHSNPEVIERAKETGGQSLIDGFSNLLRDLERGKGRLKITMTDPDAFEVGVNLATTEGSVIFENELMQLIQYAPTTEAVQERPLLIVPPWINKYYALDLTPDKSMVKWLVDQGHTVFLISWVNPGRELADKGFDDYMFEGPLAAIGVIREVTGARDVNVAGYCIGGTLVATMLAYLAAKGEHPVHSATLMACMTDFSDPGDVGVFIDDAQIETLRRAIEARGFHSGEQEMSGVFSLMRANDLIWSHVINNYLLAKETLPFDMVYWFQDATRLPAKMIHWYLDTYYNKNLLREPGGVVIGGAPLDLRKVETPIYFMSADEDHICPWASTYDGAQLFGGEKVFVLGGSGHNAGVVNPPNKVKYGYRTNDDLSLDADAWHAGSTKNEGSWWPHWNDWLIRRNGGDTVPPRLPGGETRKVIEAAPGRYVKAR
jgi:polyhydroxyalkanoate synthase